MRVGIIGLGTVGHGVYELLKKTDIEVVKVINKTHIGDYPEMVHSIDDILNDDSIDTIIEVVGGIEFPYMLIKQAMMNGKNVVTANKALLSKYFRFFNELAETYGVALKYEASCCGGITVVDPVTQLSQFNKIQRITGIMNGSTNFILTKVFQHDASFDDAIEEAFQLGYLETGSNDDMEGLDSMRKLNILSSICYQEYISEDDVYVKELALTDNMIAYLKENNLTVKYIASSRKDETVSLRVEPLVMKRDSKFANVSDGSNLVEFESDLLGCFDYFGPGAGRYETASAVLYDLFQIKNDNQIAPLIGTRQSKVNNEIVSDYLVEYENVVKVVKNINESDIKNEISYLRIAGEDIG